MIKIYIMLGIVFLFINPRSKIEYPCIIGNTKQYYSIKKIEKGKRIIIPKLNLNLEIKDQTDHKTLKNYIGTLEGFNSNHLILAGHNYLNMFGTIYKLSKNDLIIISNNQQHTSYYVKEKHIIKDNDMSYFKETDSLKLTLITCTLNDDERLLVIATSDF